MRKVLGVAIILAAIVSCKSGGDSKKELSTEPIAMEIGIEGMSCNGCVATVESSVKQIGDGITSVKVNLEKKNALIEYVPAKVDATKIKEAIELNGYKVSLPDSQ